MVKVSCNSVLWEVYRGVSGQGGAPTGPSPLLEINKSPTGWRGGSEAALWEEPFDFATSLFVLLAEECD